MSSLCPRPRWSPTMSDCDESNFDESPLFYRFGYMPPTMLRCDLCRAEAAMAVICMNLSYDQWVVVLCAGCYPHTFGGGGVLTGFMTGRYGWPC